ncbi:hypothetical protein BaRGS_00007422, partial [Batillaria attramentaria]
GPVGAPGDTRRKKTRASAQRRSPRPRALVEPFEFLTPPAVNIWQVRFIAGEFIEEAGSG